MPSAVVRLLRLPHPVSSVAIIDALAAFGQIQSLNMDSKEQSIATVEFSNVAEAKAAVQQGKVDIKGKCVVIKSCKKGIGEQLSEIKSLESGEEALTAIMQSCGISRSQMKARRTLCARVQRLFPAGKVELYGSSVTLLGTSTGDVDLCLMEDSGMDINDALKIIQDGGFTGTFVVPSNKCPIVRFFDKKSHLSCELSLNNQLALHNTKLLCEYVKHGQPWLQVLLVVVKTWAVTSDIKISGYALVIMVIAYLQKEGVFPYLQEDINEEDDTQVEGEKINGWDCRFRSCSVDNNKTMDIYASNNVTQYLRGFFDLYGYKWEYAFQGIGISRRSGVDVRSDMKPFELSHNTTHSVTPRTLDHMLHAMRLAVDKLHLASVGQIRWGNAMFSIAAEPLPLDLWSMDILPKSRNRIVDAVNAAGGVHVVVWAVQNGGVAHYVTSRCAPDDGPRSAKRIKVDSNGTVGSVARDWEAVIRLLNGSLRVWCDLGGGSADVYRRFVHDLAQQLDVSAGPHHVALKKY